MTPQERNLIKQAVEHLELSKELHNSGDMKAYGEARKGREILIGLLAADAKPTPAQARKTAAAALLAFDRKEISTDQLKTATKELNAATRAAVRNNPKETPCK